MSRDRIGVAVIGFGWMGRAHSRSYARIPMIFDDRSYDPELVVCADSVEQRRHEAVHSFGFREATADWQAAMAHPDVQVVAICAPNMLHEDMVAAAASAGKHVFCEKPVGGTPEQTVRAEKAVRSAGVVSGVGYNYRFAPLVQYAKALIDAGELGVISNYRGRFFSMYGADPMGLLTWRFKLDQAGYGVSTDILSHSMDLAMMLNGPITSVVGTGETFIERRPLPRKGGTHYDRGNPDDPTGEVTNEDYFAALVVFANGSRGSFEASRSIIGPESQMAFDIYGTEGALGWNLETMNELRLFLTRDRARGYTTVRGGDRYPCHGCFVPGDANSIGFEDLITIEDHEFLAAVAAGRAHSAGFERAVEFVSVQAALLRSWESGRWEDVVSLRID
ncbi:MAG: Gfo/Idh/MocA family protein [Acidimicrobiales bacterium]